MYALAVRQDVRSHIVIAALSHKQMHVRSYFLTKEAQKESSDYYARSQRHRDGPHAAIHTCRHCSSALVAALCNHTLADNRNQRKCTQRNVKWSLGSSFIGFTRCARTGNHSKCHIVSRALLSVHLREVRLQRKDRTLLQSAEMPTTHKYKFQLTVTFCCAAS